MRARIALLLKEIQRLDYAGKVLGASAGEVKQVGQITKHVLCSFVVFLAAGVHQGRS